MPVNVAGFTRRIVSHRVYLPTTTCKLLSTVCEQPTSTRGPKQEGTISAIFTSLTGESTNELPQRFSDLKKEIWKDSLLQSWREVLYALETAVDVVSTKGSDIIPRVAYDDIVKGLSAAQISAVKKIGTVVVTGGVPKEEAFAWKQSIRDYTAANSDRVRGFPPENIQVYEIYNSKAQIFARTHQALINTQRFLLSLWHVSDEAAAEISLDTPISYFDRLRMRQPGDQTFSLGPHVDGGSIERWEDPSYRACYAKVLQGDSAWRQHDPFDATPRIYAKQDLYHAPNQCSIFRPWQGWTSLSSIAPTEGTLRVLPFLSLASAYMILRPFFRPRSMSQSKTVSLAFEDWELDLDGTAFPGSGLGKAQELSEKTHPHLRLDKAMVSVPRVEPGDQVYWHCDVVHAVESQHRGPVDSSVLYIPVVPLTLKNANYLRDQRANFVDGLPAPDFPGGEGESKFTGRATAVDVKTPKGRQVLGLEPFDAFPGGSLITAANQILSREVHVTSV